LRRLACIAILATSACARNAAVDAVGDRSHAASAAASSDAAERKHATKSDASIREDAAAAEDAARAVGATSNAAQPTRVPSRPGYWTATLNSRPPFAQVTVLPSGPTLGTTPLMAEFESRMDRIELQFSLNGIVETRLVSPAEPEVLVEFSDSGAAPGAGQARPKGTPRSKKKKASR